MGTASRGSRRPREIASTEVAGRRVPISEDGRRLLREAVVELGLDVETGNKIADWLDAHPTAQVTIEGRTPLPPLRVYGYPDGEPPVRQEEEGEGEAHDQQVVSAGVDRT